MGIMWVPGFMSPDSVQSQASPLLFSALLVLRRVKFLVAVCSEKSCQISSIRKKWQLRLRHVRSLDVVGIFFGEYKIASLTAVSIKVEESKILAGNVESGIVSDSGGVGK